MFACSNHWKTRKWEEHLNAKNVPIVGKMNWERGVKLIYVHRLGAPCH